MEVTGKLSRTSQPMEPVESPRCHRPFCANHQERNLGVSQPHHRSRNGSRPESAPPPAAPAGDLRLEDRSHLLRRTPRSLSATDSYDGNGGVRLRRERRVNAPFSGIPALSRNGHH